MLNNKFKIIAIIAGIMVLFGVIGFFIWRGGSPLNSKNPLMSLLGDISGNQAPTQNESQTSSEELQTYQSAKYNFSFEYPKGFSVAEFIEREATDIILIQNTETRRGFQVAISPFGGPALITPESILKDIPDMKINEPKNTISSGIRALEFLSDDGGAPKAEIWFINKGYLYQITAFEKDKDLIEKVLSSWVFK